MRSFLFRRHSRRLGVGKQLKGARTSSYLMSLGGVGLLCVVSVVRFRTMHFSKNVDKGIRLHRILRSPIVRTHLSIGSFSLGRTLLKHTSVLNS